MLKDVIILGLFGLSIPVTSQVANCITSTGSNTPGSNACCSTQPSGLGGVQGQEFQYSCQYYAMPFNQPSLPALTVRDCAIHCQQDDTCLAATWVSAQRTCFLTSAANYQPKEDLTNNLGYILLTKTGNAANETDACEVQVETAIEKCKEDQEAECEQQKDAAAKICEAEKLKLANDSGDKVKQIAELTTKLTSSQNQVSTLDTEKRLLLQLYSSGKNAVTVTVEGKRYTVQYGKYYTSTYYTLARPTNLLDCLKLCGKDSKCKSAGYNIDTQHCVGWTSKRTPDRSNTWSSYAIMPL